MLASFTNLRHVVHQRECSIGTTLVACYASGADRVVDPRSGILVSRVGRFGVHVAIVGRSGRYQGPGGFDWRPVEFRVQTGHWATLMQLRQGLAWFNNPTRSGKRWPRLPG